VKTATLPEQWAAPGKPLEPRSIWPRTLAMKVAPSKAALSAPSPENFGISDPFGPNLTYVGLRGDETLQVVHLRGMGRKIPLPPMPRWPRVKLPVTMVDAVLPIPAEQYFAYTRVAHSTAFVAHKRKRPAPAPATPAQPTDVATAKDNPDQLTTESITPEPGKTAAKKRTSAKTRTAEQPSSYWSQWSSWSARPGAPAVSHE
jgi:hypothetical protein